MRRIVGSALLCALAGALALAGEVGADGVGSQVRVSQTGVDGNSAADADSAAIAYDSVRDQYLVVWDADPGVAPLADEEQEIFGRIMRTDGTPVGSEFRISDVGADGNAALDATNPSVAYDPVLDEYLVTW